MPWFPPVIRRMSEEDGMVGLGLVELEEGFLIGMFVF